MTGSGLARGQWGTRIEIKSESSGRIYVVAEKLANGRPTGTWGCSCPGWLSRRACKHLTRMHLRSCEDPITPRPRGQGKYGGAFTDAAYKHYDTRNGYGSAEEWARLAEDLAAGRGRYVPPPPRQAGRQTPDMALLGLTAMPADVKELVRAYRRAALAAHPDTGGSHEQFLALNLAYERLLRRYPK
jgi:hypothetical protein